MSFVRLGIAVMLAATASVAIVALAAQERIRLQLEVRKGDAVVARPQLILAPGTQGWLELDGIAKVALTPTNQDPDRIAIAFEIDSASGQLRPRLVLSDSTPGSIQFTPAAGADPVTLAVAWLR